MTKIHKTAVIEDGAELDSNVSVGPYSIVSSKTRIGAGTEVGPHVLIEGNVEIGSGNVIRNGAVIGTPPQDWSYKGNDTGVKIGNDNVLREYITINRSTTEGSPTEIGDENMIMAYCHVAHDCSIGCGNALANGVTLAGHVKVHDHVMMGGLTPVHQFVTIGSYAMVGGLSRLNKDVPPYVRIAGNPAKIFDLNVIGLRRNNFSDETRRVLKKAYKIVFRSKNNTSQALKQIRSELPELAEIKQFVEFIENSERGIHK
ncbi:MAG: acyl-ACP--UDP-N-acetylglucosamine O-acyltransferase [bacterium]